MNAIASEQTLMPAESEAGGTRFAAGAADEKGWLTSFPKKVEEVVRFTDIELRWTPTL